MITDEAISRVFLYQVVKFWVFPKLPSIRPRMPRSRRMEYGSSAIHSDEWPSRDDNLYESSLQTISVIVDLLFTKWVIDLI